jgi:hypothetical protein
MPERDADLRTRITGAAHSHGSASLPEVLAYAGRLRIVSGAFCLTVRAARDAWTLIGSFIWTLIGSFIWTLINPVSCVSYVSWSCWVNAAETHETFRWESGMRYHVSSWPRF